MGKTLLTASAFAILASSSYSCCGVSNGPRVEFFGQRNIIVWNDETKTEDFIRSAQFRSSAKDLGFIAPTPTLPEISLAKSAAFSYLDRLNPQRSRPTGSAGGGFGGGSPKSNSPTVLQVKEVGNYLATTLKASDSKGLAEWMKINGYVTTPQIEAWTDFYIKKGWLLTCFKVINPDGVAQTGVIKLSFKTSLPLNPYKVPQENSSTSVANPGLGVHVISAEPLVPRNMGRQSTFVQRWSVRLTKQQAIGLLPLIGADSLPENASLQFFADKSFPQPSATDDIFFLPAPKKIGNNPIEELVAEMWTKAPVECSP